MKRYTFIRTEVGYVDADSLLSAKKILLEKGFTIEDTPENLVRDLQSIDLEPDFVITKKIVLDVSKI